MKSTPFRRAARTWRLRKESARRFSEAFFASYGLAQKSTGGATLAALGGLLIYRGATGKCGAYRQLGIDTTGNSERTRSSRKCGNPDRAFHRDRSLADGTLLFLARSFESPENHAGDQIHSRGGGSLALGCQWTRGSRGIMGCGVHHPKIQERSSPGNRFPSSTVQNAGSVHFEAAQDRSSTTVKVALQYLPPAGHAGALVAHLFGAAPEKMLESALARFKETMETQS